MRQEELDELEHVKQVYEQAGIYFKIKLAFIPTRANRDVIIILACVAGTRVSRKCSLI